MKQKLRKIFDKTFLLYVALGFLNYTVCSAVMLLFRHMLRVPENYCLYISFLLQTAFSFVLNRYVTFRGIAISPRWQLKFLASVLVCVLAARVLLKQLLTELMRWTVLQQITLWLYEQINRLVPLKLTPAQFRADLILLTCTFTYSVMNYVGQRYFVFKPVKRDTECPPPQADKTDGGSDPDPRSAPEST